MPSENVEIVEGLYECFARRDNETPFEYFAEDIEWDARGSRILGLDEVFRGHSGVRLFWTQWLEAWDEIDYRIEGPVELDDGRVAVVVRQRNLARGAGIWIDHEPYRHLWTLEGGKVTRVEYEPLAD